MKNELHSAPASDVAVRYEGVGKRYILRTHKPFLVQEALRRLVRRGPKGNEFWALRDISLTIRAGESVAFMGGNGAGKSTILGLTAGTVSPTCGTVITEGRIGALLELGAGFHPDLTGRENVYLNASLLGMSRAQVEERFQPILAFSELEQFIDVPLRNYSSGMQVRLGFSVAVHIDPELLIVDEVLAVGDQHFQGKCIRRLQEFREAGKTLLFVSHNPDAVRQMCERVIWLDHGRLRADGPADAVLKEYERAMV